MTLLLSNQNFQNKTIEGNSLVNCTVMDPLQLDDSHGRSISCSISVHARNSILQGVMSFFVIVIIKKNPSNFFLTNSSYCLPTFFPLHSSVQMFVKLRYASHSNVMEFLEYKIDILGRIQWTFSKSSNYSKLEMSSHPFMPRCNPQLMRYPLFAFKYNISKRLQ